MFKGYGLVWKLRIDAGFRELDETQQKTWNYCCQKAEPLNASILKENAYFRKFSAISATSAKNRRLLENNTASQCHGLNSGVKNTCCSDPWKFNLPTNKINSQVLITPENVTLCNWLDVLVYQSQLRGTTWGWQCGESWRRGSSSAPWRQRHSALRTLDQQRVESYKSTCIVIWSLLLVP